MERATIWIGGGTGSGKSTVTRILAARHGLRVFPLDARPARGVPVRL
jgi:dephospho-CoA kinase